MWASVPLSIGLAARGLCWSAELLFFHAAARRGAAPSARVPAAGSPDAGRVPAGVR
jgi:hypothetical protein